MAGWPGFSIHGGVTDAKEKNDQLRGTERYKTYSNFMANTAIVGAGVRYFLNIVCRPKWTVSPANESAEAQAAADWVESVMDDMRTPWHRVVRRSAMFRFLGFSIQEWQAKRRDDGTLGLADIAPRPQWTIEKWDVDDNGYVIGAVQRSPQSNLEIYLPTSKIVYITDDALSDHPEGVGLLRHVAKQIFRLERYEQLEGIGYEGDMRGIPSTKAPLSELEALKKSGQLKKEDVDAILKPLKDFVENHIKSSDTALLLDSAVYRGSGDQQTPSAQPKWSVELLGTQTTGLTEIAAAVERLNREIARVLGVEQLLLGSNSRGSHALSRDKTSALFLIADATLKEIRETFNRDIIHRLWEINGFDEALRPKFQADPIKFQDIETMSSALRDLATAGVVLMPEDEAVTELFQLMGLTRPDVTIDRGMDLNDNTGDEDGA
jgi:hypothetical protein